MDYEKAYNDAKARLEMCLRTGLKIDPDYIFPELRESEDERIRKFLKDYAIEMIAGLESDISISVYDGVKGHDPDAEEELEKWRGARAWLEKRKEQMMKEALEGTVDEDNFLRLTNGEFIDLCPGLDMVALGLKPGDKVKLIIVKEQ